MAADDDGDATSADEDEISLKLSYSASLSESSESRGTMVLGSWDAAACGKADANEEGRGGMAVREADEEEKEDADVADFGKDEASAAAEEAGRPCSAEDRGGAAPS